MRLSLRYWAALVLVAFASLAGCDLAPTPSANQPTHAAQEATVNVTKEPYGKLDDGTEVDLYTLKNGRGITVKLVTYGAMIVSIDTPDREGHVANITLSRDNLADYVAKNPHFGVFTGRFANRIAKGKFTLDGNEYSLATNNGPNHLHGGLVGFDKIVWKAEAVKGDGFVGVKFFGVSPDGDQGYPGNLTVAVTYSLNNNDELTIDYEATTDKPTIVNLTNHAYWNLSGNASRDVLGHRLTINAGKFLPVDDTLIPLGPPQAVAGTPMDFTKPMTVGSRIDRVEGGYDHCYILEAKPNEEMTYCARLEDPNSGRVLEISTTEPAVQFYSGNFLDGSVTSGGVVYQKHYGMCLETQHYPDSPNRPEYPSVVLRPGEIYRHKTVHKFSVE